MEFKNRMENCMKNSFQRIVVALLVLVALIVAICPMTFAAGQPSSYSKTSNSGDRDTVCTTLDGTSASTYYTGNYTYEKLAAQSSTTLLNTLRTFMSTTHKKETSYADCSSKASITDCENNNGKVTLIYTSYVANQSDAGGGGSGWDREHVWPKSQGGFEKTGAGSDLHHIRPSDSRVNNTRSSQKYGEVNGGSAVNGNLSGTIGGYSNGTYFEPHDNVKGDVARICLYVYVRWGGQYSKSNNILNVFQSVDVLLDWCELDPVDTWEMGRNEVVQNIQGNRNVFIDYPELAWNLFGRSVPTGMTTPSGNAEGGSQGGNQGGSDDSGNQGTTTCQHTNTAIRNQKDATCSVAGYTGDRYCTSCGTITVKGSNIPATGEHTYGEAVNNVKVCSSCGKMVAIDKCKHPETVTVGEKESCTEFGYSGDTVCKDCGALIEEGTVTPASGHNWQSVSDRLESCTVCGEARTKVEDNNTGVVIAAVGGGVGGAAVIGVALFFILRRRFI